MGSPVLVFSQPKAVDHWETVIYADHTWQYFVGQTEPDANWRLLAFDDHTWSSGIGGFGYGDDDDQTVIETTISLYLRIRFVIKDTSKIVKAIFNMDYDDAFVAYLNDVEIARANIGVTGDHPVHDQTADGLREAEMYQGGQPVYFYLDYEKLRSCLHEGDNVLAIQVHNESITSSDLSAIPFFSVGIADDSNQYLPTPSWFSAPFDFVSSNLAIININTDGQEIPDEPRIIAHMGIINNPVGTRNFLTQAYNGYDGRISIEIRGQSAQMFPKKSFGIETQDEHGDNLNVSLLGMPEENDWILYAPYSDKTLIRNELCFHLARAMGGYSSRTQFCELILNDEYQGIYLLMEKIKRDKNRVDIATVTPADTTGDQLTGGYIIKVDKPDDESHPGWLSPVVPPYPNWGRFYFQFHDPAPDEIMPAQESYIQNFIREFETALVSSNFSDPVNGYARHIDMDTFVDHFILREFSKEIDSYKYSTYMYKDKDSIDGRLKMGPFWDFNLGFGNVNFGHERAMYTDGWMYNTGIPHMYWWYRLIRDEQFRTRLNARWSELRQGVFHTDSVLVFIDNTVTHIAEASKRNFEKWPVIGEEIWPNFYVGNSYEDEVNYLKDWIVARLEWMDENMPGRSGIRVMPADETAISTDDFKIYPNPFTNSTIIRYHLLKPGQIKIIIYNLLGQKVRTLLDSYNAVGMKQLQWDGKNESGNFVASGLFFYKVYINDKAITQGKLIRRN